MSSETNLQSGEVVFDEDVNVTMRGVSDSVGLPYTVNSVSLVDREALIELREGPPGPTGSAGAPAWPWQWQGDVTDPAALADMKPAIEDAGKAWRVISENSVYLWTGMEFVAFRNAFGTTGYRGEPNMLTGTGVALPPGSNATAQLLGEAPNQRLEIGFPRGADGAAGDPGAPGRISDAADVRIGDEDGLGREHVLAWDSADEVFRPMPSPRVGGPWAIAGRQFTGGSNLNQPTQVLAAITIPSQPTDWRPMVQGSVRLSGNNARCDLEVRIGSPDGPMVGFGFGRASTNDQQVLIGPKFEYPIAPGSTIGVVPMNQTTTMYVVVRRVSGTGTYTVRNDGAQLIVHAQPV